MEELHCTLLDYSLNWPKDIFARPGHPAANHDPIRVEQPDDVTKRNPNREANFRPDLGRDRIAGPGRLFQPDRRTFLLCFR